MNQTAHRFADTGLESPLPGVKADAWQRFITALEVQPTTAQSESAGLGAFDIRARRLVELGYAKHLPLVRNEKGRYVQQVDFVLPLTMARFLSDPVVQYKVLAKSMRAYYDALQSGELVKPTDMSIAGALAVLHIGGRGALKAWPDLFSHTRALYEKAQGAF